MSIKRKKMISAICWPLGYHLETHRLQKDAILQCSSAQFSTIWVFGIGHQMMYPATFHQLIQPNIPQENWKITQLSLKRQQKTRRHSFFHPWQISKAPLVDPCSHDVSECANVPWMPCGFHRLHRYCATTKWPNGRFQVMCSKHYSCLSSLYICECWLWWWCGSCHLLMISCLYYRWCLRKNMLAQFFWKILNGFEWIISQYINNIFIMTDWNTLKLPMPGQLRCPQEAAVWHLVNLFEHHLMGNRSKFRWDNWFWLGKMRHFNGKIDFPSFHGKLCWIFHGFSPEPQPPDTAVVFRYWDSMQISFLGLQHHCKARRVIWSHMESYMESLSLPQHLRSLVTLVLISWLFLSISEHIWTLRGVFVGRIGVSRWMQPFHTISTFPMIFSTFHHFHHHPQP